MRLLEPNPAQAAQLGTERLFLRNAYYNRALALTDLKRFAEAVKDWDQVIEFEGPRQLWPRMERAMILARAGDHVKAVTEANDLTSNPKTPGRPLYNAACVFVVSMTTVKADALLRERYASKALALLRRTQAAGYFQNAKEVEHLQKDDDLAALRDRADFKAFVVELVKQLPAKEQAGPAKPMQP